MSPDTFWKAISIPRTVFGSAAFVGNFTGHVTRQPYRRPIAGSSPATGRQRIRAAVYDSVLQLTLDGYAHLAGVRLRPDTGPLVVCLNRMLAAFDDTYEARLADGSSLAFAEVVGDPHVQERMDTLVSFLAPHPSGPAIRAMLADWADAQYDRYVRLSTDPAAGDDPTRQLELAVLDSGGFATCFANCIGLFHDARPPEPIVEEFAHLGVLGKLADDIVDFWDDRTHDRINLLSGLLRQNPAEYTVVVDAPPEGRTGISWWRRHCPRTYADLTELLADRRSLITCRQLRLAADFMLLPARWGRTVIRSGPTGLRI